MTASRADGSALMAHPAVDLAAPTLRTRCCGGHADRGENRDLDGQFSNLTMGVRLENGSGLARVFVILLSWSVQPCIRPVDAAHQQGRWP